MFVFVFVKKLTRISLVIVLVSGPSGNRKLAYWQSRQFRWQFDDKYFLGWSLTTLPRLRKQILWHHGLRNVTCCLDELSKTILVRYLCGTLPSVSLKRIFVFSVGGLFSLSTHALTCLRKPMLFSMQACDVIFNLSLYLYYLMLLSETILILQVKILNSARLKSF